MRGLHGAKKGFCRSAHDGDFFWWLLGPYRIVWKINCSVPKKCHDRYKIRLDYYRYNIFVRALVFEITEIIG